MKKKESLKDSIYKTIRESIQEDNGLNTEVEVDLSQSKVFQNNLNRGNGSKSRDGKGNGAAPRFSFKHQPEIKATSIDLMEYWRIILKRKWIAISICSLIVLFVGILTFSATPQYRARTTILIEEPYANMLNIQEMFSSYPRYDYMNYFFNTQLKLLKSSFLAERVAKNMDLKSRPELQPSNKSKQNVFQMAKSFISFRWLRTGNKSKKQEQAPKTNNDPNLRFASFVLGGLSVVPVKDTRLVQLGYTSPYPVLASDVVNALAEEFFAYSVETRYEATQQASEFLTSQITQLQEDLATKEREIQKYGEEKKLFFLNDKESTVISKFADLNDAFTKAQIERIKSEAAYRELKGLKVDSLPPFVNNVLIRGLKVDYAKMKNEYREKSKIFKPDYPEMVNRREKIKSMEEELDKEISKAVKAAATDYRSALNKEKSLEAILNLQKKNVIEMNSNAINYNSLKIEVENKRMLLNSLVAKQNETLVSARLGGLKTSNIRIVDKAKVPTFPVSPDKEGNMLLSLLLGIISGLGVVFLLDYLDNSIKGPHDVEQAVGLPSLGIVPHIESNGKNGNKGYSYYFKAKGFSSQDKLFDDSKNGRALSDIELINHYYPKFSLAEDYRTIRTSILLSDSDMSPKVISVVSALPKEGKTATVVNTAISFAQLDKKVLVIDADLRKPRIHKIFNLKRNLSGLSGYLAGKVRIEEAIHKTSINNLYFLPSGPFPPYPGELVGSQRMKELLEFLKKYFDYIFIDTPPVLSVTDGITISTIAEGTIIVLKPFRTSKKDFTQAVQDIQKTKTYIFGVVFNDTDIRKKRYYSSYYRRNYHNYYYGNNSNPRKAKIREKRPHASVSQ